MEQATCLSGEKIVSFKRNRGHLEILKARPSGQEDVYLETNQVLLQTFFRQRIVWKTIAWDV